jgi:hypothetical protein
MSTTEEKLSRDKLCKNDSTNKCKELTTINYDSVRQVKLIKPVSTGEGLEIKFEGLTDSYVELGKAKYTFNQAKLFSNSYSESPTIVASMVLYHEKKGETDKKLQIHIPFEKNTSYHSSLMWLNNILYTGSTDDDNTMDPGVNLSITQMIPLNTPYYYVKDGMTELIFFDRYFPLSIGLGQLTELKRAVGINGKLNLSLSAEKAISVFYNNAGVPSEEMSSFSEHTLDCDAVEIDGEKVVVGDSEIVRQKDGLTNVYSNLFESDFFWVVISVLIALIAFYPMKNILEKVSKYFSVSVTGNDGGSANG